MSERKTKSKCGISERLKKAENLLARMRDHFPHNRAHQDRVDNAIRAVTDAVAEIGALRKHDCENWSDMLERLKVPLALIANREDRVEVNAELLLDLQAEIKRLKAEGTD